MTEEDQTDVEVEALMKHWMEERQPKNRLRAALNSIGRRERRLSATSLMHHELVLSALYGDGYGRVSSEEQLLLATRIERVMREIIAAYGGGPEGRAAQVVFASESEFFGLNVNDRIAVVATEQSDRAFSQDQYERLRIRVIAHMTEALPHELAIAANAASVGLPSAVPPAARQLYRYAQQAAVLLDAFCALASHEAAVRKRGEDYACFRLIPSTGTYQANEALWEMACCQTYMRAIEADHEQCDFLRERISVNWWLGSRLIAGFSVDEVGLLTRTLNDRSAGTVSDFVEALRENSEGELVYDQWLELLSGRRAGLVGLRNNLIELCACLQRLAPNETLSVGEASEIFRAAVLLVGSDGLVESGFLPDDGEDHSITGLVPSHHFRRYHGGILSQVNWGLSV